MAQADRPTAADVLAAAAVAAGLAGAPATAHALLTRTNPLVATRAAGTLLLPREQRAGRLLAAAVVAHAALSLGWAVVLAAILPRRRTAVPAVAAGLAIAALDLGVVGRRFPRVRALALVPQILDHVAYAVTVGAVLERRRPHPVSPP